MLEGLCEGQWHMLENIPANRESEEHKEAMKDFCSAVRGLANRQRLVQKTEKEHAHYQQVLGKLIAGIRSGEINTALVNRIAFIVRNDRYDPDYASKLLNELCVTLDLPSFTEWQTEFSDEDIRFVDDEGSDDVLQSMGDQLLMAV